MIDNDIYFCEEMNSSKAYQFTCIWHYSHLGFKNAKINLGIYRKDTNRLVGVLQWGRSGSKDIKLNRYVKENIKLEDYLELNRFCMVDEEPHNSESQAISLGIKWIKKFRPNVQLLVSYAGRVEGNYGYIYQATNWEYLGYFISKAFWIIDNKERHNIGISLEYAKRKNKKQSLIDFLCSKYSVVKNYDSKQFIYIQRLNKNLHVASNILTYPKVKTDYPIVTKMRIYKNESVGIEDDNIIKKDFYYEYGEPLFTNNTYRRRGELVRHRKRETDNFLYGVYNKQGDLEKQFSYIKDIVHEGYEKRKVLLALQEGSQYKKHYFVQYKKDDVIPKKIFVPCIAWINDEPFYSMPDIATFCKVTRQMVHQSKKHNGTQINGNKVKWNLEKRN